MIGLMNTNFINIKNLKFYFIIKDRNVLITRQTVAPANNLPDFSYLPVTLDN